MNKYQAMCTNHEANQCALHCVVNGITMPWDFHENGKRPLLSHLYIFFIPRNNIPTRENNSPKCRFVQSNLPFYFGRGCNEARQGEFSPILGQIMLALKHEMRYNPDEIRQISIFLEKVVLSISNSLSIIG